MSKSPKKIICDNFFQLYIRKFELEWRSNAELVSLKMILDNLIWDAIEISEKQYNEAKSQNN